MNIDSINNGIVIDHIGAGKSLEIYHLLKLERLSCSVAIIKNVRSVRLGKKDIIKIDENIDVNLDILGYLDPNITVNIIENGVRVAKKKMELPKRLTNVITCKNPRCITSTESSVDQVFYLTNAQKRLYRCAYCDAANK